MRRILFIIVVILLGVTSFQLWMTKDRTSQKADMDQSSNDASASQIGGSFTLTDQNGAIVHDTDFHGHILLVFFGFTHCPDICPVTVATLSKAMELLGDKANQVSPLFISLDPDRDTPAVLKDFLSNFDKRIVGLTGTPEQIKSVAEAYKVYYAKSSASPEKQEKDYSIDHSGYIYMMGKDGKFLRVFPYNATEKEIAHAAELAN